MCKDLKHMQETSEGFLASLAVALIILVLAPWIVELIVNAVDVEAKLAAAKNRPYVERWIDESPQR